LPACEIETTEDAHVMRRGKFGPAREVVMARSRFDDPIEPMTLSNMRENGVRCRSLSGVSKVAWPIRPYSDVDTAVIDRQDDVQYASGAPE